MLYQTRIQKERFGERIGDYEKARGKYIVDKAVMDCMKRDAVVMHPLPRLDEITEEVDADPRAAYFRQVGARGRGASLSGGGFGGEAAPFFASPSDGRGPLCSCSRAQAHNGLYIRMALLKVLLKQ